MFYRPDTCVLIEDTCQDGLNIPLVLPSWHVCFNAGLVLQSWHICFWCRTSGNFRLNISLVLRSWHMCFWCRTSGNFRLNISLVLQSWHVCSYLLSIICRPLRFINLWFWDLLPIYSSEDLSFLCWCCFTVVCLQGEWGSVWGTIKYFLKWKQPNSFTESTHEGI